MKVNLNNYDIQMSQNANKDLNILIAAFKSGLSFSFTRFSDGETEIIRNNKLFIGPEYVSSSAGTFKFNYPPHDFKDFDPVRDSEFREELINAARFKAKNFIKGIRTKNNYKGIQDREMMIEFNMGDLSNLTFTDLLINSNYKKFRRDFLPLIIKTKNVYLIANYRANVAHINSNWNHIAIPDNFIPNYKQVLVDVLQIVVKLPVGSTILSSASSLSNLIGHSLWAVRKDITFIDIGTAIHDLIGMGSGNREYHIVNEKLDIKNVIKKTKYILKKSYYLKW